LNILAFDTSSPACSVALLHGDTVRVLHKITPKLHAQLILAMINELLTEANLTLANLDVIAYGCGPGSFTGIRIASCVAQGLGFASQCSLLRISSLAALAQSAYLEQDWSKLLVALDARTEQIYWATYQMNKEGLLELVGKETLCKPDEICLLTDNQTGWCGVGDGWEKYHQSLAHRLGFEPNCINSAQLPSAEAVLRLAKVQWEQGGKQGVNARDALPTYLR
jgi:tRNA threonylcarbamoyladenosine biosynthesis protein TsaB